MNEPLSLPVPAPAPSTEYTCRVCRGSFRGSEVYNQDGRYICKHCFDSTPVEDPEPARPRRRDEDWSDADRPRRSMRRDDYDDDIIRPNRSRYVNSYLTEAILVTLFCCLPFGVVAIVNASQVSSCLDRGDYRGASIASNNAKTWCGLSFGFGLAIIAIYVLVIAATIR